MPCREEGVAVPSLVTAVKVAVLGADVVARLRAGAG
jgi:hypothetical protein